MIRRIEALRYRSLLHVERELQGMHVLVGPNASGKSTFLDVPGFLGDLVREGLEEATLRRAPDWRDLVWSGDASGFELALEAEIPERLRDQLADPSYERCRYQVSLGAPPDGSDAYAFGLREEALALRPDRGSAEQTDLFADVVEAPESILESFKTRDTKTVVHKIPEGHDHFYDETGAGWSPTFKLGPRRSALANLPEDPSKFPVATWFKRTLAEATSRLVLRPEAMQSPAPPGTGRALRTDGANLPWVLRDFADEHPERHRAWTAQLSTGGPAIESVGTTVRDEDRHCYLTVHFASGQSVRSWGLSAGTLRMLALSLVGFLPELDGTILVEEPENGVHPEALRSIYRAFARRDDLQILATSHSPVLRDACERDKLLVFSTDDQGATRLRTADD